MKRLSTWFNAVAFLLAVLIPVEQAHCAWMSMSAPAPAADCAKGHACCPKAAEPSAPAPAPSADCLCMKLPASSLPASVIASPSSLTGASLVMTTHVAAPPLAVAPSPAPALDVGSPPLLPYLGAPGLRAPPAA